MHSSYIAELSTDGHTRDVTIIHRIEDERLDTFRTFRPAYPLSQLPETDRLLLFYIYNV